MRDTSAELTTREEIIDALTEAAELEHLLLIQYLFAAFSLKRRLDEGITPLQQAQIVSWERTLLEVARQEMGHLGLVCNLLSAIGAAPMFKRPNLPMTAESYYPLDVTFTLSRFSYSTLYRFVCFELPVDVERPQVTDKQHLAQVENLAAIPGPIYNRVGALYTQISNAIEKFEETESSRLFIGPALAQDADNWSEQLNLRLVKDKASAKEAIAEIILEGEGAAKDRQESHFARFLHILETLPGLDFEPARNVADNPFTRMHRDNPFAKGVTLIEVETTHNAAVLFNMLYNTLLLMLIQYYSYNGETPEQRKFLRDTLGQMMSSLIRPVAELLTEMPVSDDPAKGMAGPGFEITTDLRLSPFVENRWIMLKERFASAGEAAERLSKADERFKRVAQSIRFIGKNLEALNIIKSPGTFPSIPPMPDTVTLKFQGWFQCRLATDPDTFDERRGVSGVVRCLAGEPDLDRIIRFHDPVVKRSHTPDIGVCIRQVIFNNKTITTHPLLNARFNLEQEPQFLGYNGIISNDFTEPIVPFVISIRKNDLYLQRAITDKTLEYPFLETRPFNIALGGNDIYENSGVWNPDAMIDERIRLLELDKKNNPTMDKQELYNLTERIRFLKQIDKNNSRVATQRFSGRENWILKLTGSILDQNNPYLRIDPQMPWGLNFWMGCWDPDGMCGYVSGILQLPKAVLLSEVS